MLDERLNCKPTLLAMLRSGERWCNHAATSTARCLGLVSCVLLLPELASAQRVNLAKFQATTADSVYSSSEAPIRNGTDGVANNDSRWYVLSGSPHWLQVELPLAMTVGSAPQLFNLKQDVGESEHIVATRSNEFQALEAKRTAWDAQLTPPVFAGLRSSKPANTKTNSMTEP